MTNLHRPRLVDKPSVEAHTWIDAPPELVWPLIADITVMPILSEELYAVEWLDPASEPRTGAAFRGHNRRGDTTWTTVSYLVDYQPNHAFAWAVNDLTCPGAIWRFDLTADRGGTTLTQSVQMGSGPSGISMAIERNPDRERAIVASRLRQFSHGMTHNLDAIKAIAEGRRSPIPANPSTSSEDIPRPS